MGKTRLQFDFNDEAVACIDALQEQLNLATRAEVVRNALRAYEFLAQFDEWDHVEVRSRGGALLQNVAVRLLTRGR